MAKANWTSNQPTNLNYLSPVNFDLSINKLPKTRYFCTGVTGGEGYCTVGYRGTNPFDAGVFYCPYVPLQMVRAVGEDTFQPKIGFKTRYGMVSNPFVGATPSDGLATANTNSYYRSFEVLNLL